MTLQNSTMTYEIIIVLILDLLFFTGIGLLILILRHIQTVTRKDTKPKTHVAKPIHQLDVEPDPLPFPYISSKPQNSNDITTYHSTKDILASGKFNADERKREYRRRGKSPSGVIDGVYNDAYLEAGSAYNDADRDWNADA